MNQKDYYGVHRQKKSDELTHWKYIKKIKTNGRTRYFYDQAELDAYERNLKFTTPNDMGGTTTFMMKNSNDLFDSTETYNEHSPYRKIVNNQGTLSRAQAKGERFVYDAFLKKNSTVKRASKSLKKSVNKGKKFVSNLLKSGPKITAWGTGNKKRIRINF